MMAASEAELAAHVEIVKAYAGAVATIVAALIAALVGVLGAAVITANLQRERNRQDRESQWRSHAVELTKLDAERLADAAKPGERRKPLILTFLANYRDLQELGVKTPAQLWQDIRARRISEPVEVPTIVTAPPNGRTVYCGGEGPNGHPRIALHLSEDEVVACPYCSRRYIAAARA